jgi:ADP-heptose:LPS heptosyltransferase
MNILVRRTGALGDVLETTAITARLRTENPDAVIDVQTSYPQIFAGNPHINNTKFILADYDRVIDLNGAFERTLRQLHPIDAYSEVAFGDRDTLHELHFTWTPASGRLRQITGSRYVVLHAARSWPIRTLPASWWQGLIAHLDALRYTVVLTGTRQDHDGLTGAIDLRDLLTLQEQAGLIDGAHCFVCTESGPMILAQVTRAPIIPLLTMIPPEHILHWRYGERPWRWHPVRADVPCVGCATEQPRETTYFDCRLGHRNCVSTIAFDAAEIAALVEQVARAPAL